MIVLVLLVLTTAAFAQTPECVQATGQITATGQIALACTTPGVITPPPPTLTVTTTSCPPATEGILFNCVLAASGGTPPYSWTVTGSLPSGLSLSGVSLTGIPGVVGSTNFSVTVTDSASPPATASQALTITVGSAPTGCGPPTYNCGRFDAIRRTFTWNEIPPPAGAPSQGTAPVTCSLPLTDCNSKYGLNTVITEAEYNNAHIVRISDQGDSDENCGYPSVGPGGAAEFNVFEMNSNYVSISCRTTMGIKWIHPDTGLVITSCPSGVTCPQAVDPQGWVRPQGSTAPWASSGNDVRFLYTHPNSFFTFPGTQVQERTISNGQLNSALATMGEFRYAVPCWADASLMHPNVAECGEWVANHTYVPGSTLCPSCTTWTPANPGTNVPGGTGSPPGANCAGVGMNAGACAGPHSFSLINRTNCLSGSTPPDWTLATRLGSLVTSASLTGGAATFTYTPSPGQPTIAVGQTITLTATTNGGHSTNANLFNVQGIQVAAVTANTFTTVALPACTSNQSGNGCQPATCSGTASGATCNGGTWNVTQGDIATTAQTTATTTMNASMQQIAIYDNQCVWADMWIPPQLTGGRISWGAGKVGDVTDSIWSEALGNHGGQDGAGACYAVYYNSNTKTYAHQNTCTGAVYNSICTNGTDYACTGGTWAQNYIGNAFTANATTSGGASCSMWPMVMHQDFGSKDNSWSYITGGGNAVGGVPFIDIAGNRIGAVPSGGCSGVRFWFPPSIKQLTATMFTVGSLGHMVPGFHTWMWRPPAASVPVLYMGNDFSPIPAGPWDGSVRPLLKMYFNVNDGTCTSGAGSGSGAGSNVPGLGCAGAGLNATMPLNIHRCNPTLNPAHTDSCIGTNGQRAVDWDEHSSWVSNTGTDTSPVCDQTYQNNLTSTLYPPAFAWQAEVFCWFTDGSNKVVRQAFVWNSWTLAVPFSNAAGIGSLSSDGNWWAFNSDWYCSLGNQSNTGGTAGATICGLPFARNQAYALGEKMGKTYPGGPIYICTTAGITSGSAPTAGEYCTAAGCQIHNGTVVFTYLGQNNAQSSVFLVKLQ